MKTTALIIDDEALARDVIRLYLQDHPQVEIVGECTNGKQAIDAIRSLTPELIFLDIQMPELDGFSVLNEVGTSLNSVFIFVTAHDQYALRAFEVHAFDYLLKPFEQDRFDIALTRALAHLRERKTNELNLRLVSLLEDHERSKNGVKPTYIQRVAIKDSGRIFFLRTQDIDWLEGAGDYICLHAGKATYLISDTLASMEQKLDPSQFIRIHRSVIVSADQISELIPHFNGEYYVVLKSGTRLKLSRTYRENLQTLLGSVI